MRPIIVPLTHNKARRDPILGRDPWFGNPGHKGKSWRTLKKKEVKYGMLLQTQGLFEGEVKFQGKLNLENILGQEFLGGESYEVLTLDSNILHLAKARISFH